MPADFDDQPPNGSEVTEYDRAHLTLYLRLLDADAEGADWHEVVKVLFGIEAEEAPDHARKVHGTHLARAKWLAQSGHGQLLHGAGRDQP